MKLKIGKLEISIKIKNGNVSDLPDEVREALETLERFGYKPPASKKQVESAKNAAKARQEAAKRKIADAIVSLVYKTKKAPSAYAIAKYANVSYNTVRKHKNFINEKIASELEKMKDIQAISDLLNAEFSSVDFG